VPAAPDDSASDATPAAWKGPGPFERPVRAALGAVAGLMAAPPLTLDPNIMLTIIVYAFAAAVLGGLDSPAGAVAAAYILGVGISQVLPSTDSGGDSSAGSTADASTMSRVDRAELDYPCGP